RKSGDGAVVEHAIALAMIAEGVMRAASQIYGDTIAQRGTASGQRGSARAPRAFDHFRRPRKADPLLLDRGQLPGGDPFKILEVMGPQQLFVGSRGRQLQSVATTQSGVLNAPSQERVLLHRKPMPGWQRENVVVGVEDLHGGAASPFEEEGREGDLY